MISIEEQQQLLINISKRIKRPITVYAIGGTAMMFLGFKDTTLDIDLVFKNNQDKDVFKDAIKEIGYREVDPIKVYGGRENQPEMLTLGDERFDLFVKDVIDFVFSKEMQKRAEQIHQFKDNLILKIADPHDIILMKCATERIKDFDDAYKIIKRTDINWSILLKEAETQIKLGRDRAAFDLGVFLEKLKKNKKINIPDNVLNKIFKIIEDQTKRKRI